MKTAQDRGIEIPAPERFRAITGKGVSASVNLGSPALLRAEEANVPSVLREAAETASDRGQAAIYLLRDGEAMGVFAVADAIREESRERCRPSTSGGSRWPC